MLIKVNMGMPKNQKHSPLRPCVNHFSHHHPLRPFDHIQAEELICSGCGLQVTGSPFMCSKSDCNFLLHKSCFKLTLELQHGSHPQHPLKLLSTPQNYPGKLFICNACSDHGTGFDYHCHRCKFDLHIGCAKLPQKIKHKDHQHRLTLYYCFSSIKDDIKTTSCDVCHQDVPNCEICDFGIHLRYTIPDFTDKSWKQIPGSRNLQGFQLFNSTIKCI